MAKQNKNQDLGTEAVTGSIEPVTQPQAEPEAAPLTPAQQFAQAVEALDVWELQELLSEHGRALLSEQPRTVLLPFLELVDREPTLYMVYESSSNIIDKGSDELQRLAATLKLNPSKQTADSIMKWATMITAVFNDAEKL